MSTTVTNRQHLIFVGLRDIAEHFLHFYRIIPQCCAAPHVATGNFPI